MEEPDDDGVSENPQPTGSKETGLNSETEPCAVVDEVSKNQEAAESIPQPVSPEPEESEKPVVAECSEALDFVVQAGLTDLMSSEKHDHTSSSSDTPENTLKIEADNPSEVRCPEQSDSCETMETSSDLDDLPSCDSLKDIKESTQSKISELPVPEVSEDDIELPQRTENSEISERHVETDSLKPGSPVRSHFLNSAAHKELSLVASSDPGDAPVEKPEERPGIPEGVARNSEERRPISPKSPISEIGEGLVQSPEPMACSSEERISESLEPIVCSPEETGTRCSPEHMEVDEEERKSVSSEPVVHSPKESQPGESLERAADSSSNVPIISDVRSFLDTEIDFPIQDTSESLSQDLNAIETITEEPRSGSHSSDLIAEAVQRAEEQRSVSRGCDVQDSVVVEYRAPQAAETVHSVSDASLAESCGSPIQITTEEKKLQEPIPSAESPVNVPDVATKNTIPERKDDDIIILSDSGSRMQRVTSVGSCGSSESSMKGSSSPRQDSSPRISAQKLGTPKVKLSLNRPRSKGQKVRKPNSSSVPSASSSKSSHLNNSIDSSEATEGSPGAVSPSLSCTEYAQYLGLQPTVKFKCAKCKFNFPSIGMLKEHQAQCFAAKPSFTSIPETTSVTLLPTNPNTQSQNLRITRKVFLCSTCGTYFENWNLYIHMREAHRRHVCVTCLSMFVHAEDLAIHMSSKHNAIMEAFGTAGDFRSAHPSSCYLTCCTCERIFSDQDNFFDHDCGQGGEHERRGCAMCGLQFTHTTSCPHFQSPCKNKVNEPDIQPTSSGSVTIEPVNKHKGSPVEAVPNKLNNTAESIGDKPFEVTIKKNRIKDKSNAPSVSDTSTDLELNKDGKSKSSGWRIKLAPASKSISRKPLTFSKSRSIRDESPPRDEEMDLDQELAMLADDSSPIRLPNGDKSPSQSLSPSPAPPSVLSPSEKIIPQEELQPGSPLKESAMESTSPQPLSDYVEGEQQKEEPSKDVPFSPVEDVHKEEEEEESAVTSPTGAEDEIMESPEKILQQPAEDEAEEDGDKETDWNLGLDDSQDSDTFEASDVNITREPNGHVEENEKMEVDGSEDEDKWHIDENSKGDQENPSECDVSLPEPPVDEEQPPEEEELQLAGEDALLMELHFEEPVEQMPIQNVLKQAVREACIYTYCVYCTHANKIAVNGKQLAIHLLTEHRYQLVINSETLLPEKFVEIVKEKLTFLDDSYFNCDTYDNMNNEVQAPFIKSYECFQCRYVTKVHKDLYLHNRKMHQKNSLVCIMCKSNFYSYSELLCHLCPGIYMVSNQPLFRCCFCPLDNLPSAFRFMVHVRKRHQACDVCLEVCGDQQKLSNHVWKHKLLHFCYRCGIAYRNKPDITKHLFWKHGTESVLCRHCLQKKWPYVYHFCIPPSSFTCEECNASFSRAVALKVHKRLHSNRLLYPCEECQDCFISRKLLQRHVRTIHHPPPPEEMEPEVNTTTPAPEEPQPLRSPGRELPEAEKQTEIVDVTTVEPPEEDGAKRLEPPPPPVPKRDVYDLPPLNLSSESESESDTEEKPTAETMSEKPPETTVESNEKIKADDTNAEKLPVEPPPAVDSVWESFKDYKSSRDREPSASTVIVDDLTPGTATSAISSSAMLEHINVDHDYFSFFSCHPDDDEPGVMLAEPETPCVVEEANTSYDHDYCHNEEEKKEGGEPTSTQSTPKKKTKTPKKKRTKSGESGSSSSESDSSSSDSDSSSCSCSDSNCSCSSSSSSSSDSSSSDSSDSDSSDSEKKAQKKAKKKERKAKKGGEDKTESPTVNGHLEEEEPNVEDVTEAPPVLYFHESDLDTTESESEAEDFYDEHPRDLMPKRNLLLLSSAVDSVLASQQGDTPGPTPLPTPVPTPPPTELSNGLPKPLSLLEETINSVASRPYKHKKRKRQNASPRRESFGYESLLERSLTKKLKGYSTPTTPITPSAYPGSYTSQYADNLYSPAVSDIRGGSGSETDSNVRTSKRVRVPKKFFGDSSDEEGTAVASPLANPWQMAFPRPQKKKSRGESMEEVESIASIPSAPSVPPRVTGDRIQDIIDYVAAGYDGRTVDDENYLSSRRHRQPAPKTTPKLILTIPNHVTSRSRSTSCSEESEDESEPEETPMQVDLGRTEQGEDSDDEEEQEEEQEESLEAGEIRPYHQSYQTPSFEQQQQQPRRKLYCYCRCPYDEVSEMIACDGMNCAIEWFHFECVGITVAPQGKWYCPDCRKRYNMIEPSPNPEYFYNPSSEYMMSSTQPSSHAYPGT